MLETIRNTALSVCGTMIITGIFMMLIPSVGRHQTLRLAVSLFFLLSLAVPFTGERAEWEAELTRWDRTGETVVDFQTRTRELLLADFRSRLEEQAMQILRDEDIDPAGLEFMIHIDEQDRISITGLELLLDENSASRADTAISRLNGTFGVTVTLSLCESGGKDENDG